MFVTDKYDEENCRGNNVTEEGGTCAKGRYLLSVDLPTGTDSENKCGTLRTQKDQMKRFENTIQVELGGNSKASHTFTVYCEWESNTFRSAGVLVASKPQNNRGESLFADVSMLVLDSTNKPFGENPRIHTKDKIKFLVMVKVDDTYGALLPTYCTASPSGSMYSPKGDNLNQQLLMDSCPVTSLPTNNQMRFRRKNGKAYEMITDEMNLIKLKVGTTVYIHCKVKLCLRGTEDFCSMPNCTTNTRRKREAENEGYLEEDATVKLTLIDDNNSYTSGMSTITMTTMGFSVVISLLVALVMIIVSVLIVLVMRLRARGNKVNDTIQLADKPQRFSLPRINRNHLRI
ncbi:hypothetical protein LSH36_1240g00019 [Paralvinella palmiformis]|uniref:ZP domain-containing protein n=1 Tax=Paralvinella palmiformis TaxID=53620 RepID=A0AAD9MR62_9ANNE|nr:hypothetical protein LSH36_1240g00019 [Paralvinella palmiformis]